MTTQSAACVRAYALDPATATLRAITLPRESGPHLAALYREFGAHTVNAVSLSDTLTAFIDDEGLLVPQPAVWGFISRPGVIYAGRAVILGHDEDGEPADPPAPIETVAALLLAFVPRDPHRTRHHHGGQLPRTRRARQRDPRRSVQDHPRTPAGDGS